jgi:hypothetical protein
MEEISKKRLSFIVERKEDYPTILVRGGDEELSRKIESFIESKQGAVPVTEASLNEQGVVLSLDKNIEEYQIRALKQEILRNVNCSSLNDSDCLNEASESATLPRNKFSG